MKNTKYKRKKILFAGMFIVLFFAVSALVMVLWNCILPEVTGVKELSFWQAMGILVLSKILFGGFRKCGRGKSHRFQGIEMMKRMKHMTPEEREIFKTKLKERYGNKGICTK